MMWDLTSLSGTHEVVGAAPVSNGPWNYAFNFCENVDTSPAAVCVTPVTAPTSAYRVEDYPSNVQCDNLGAPPRSAAACWSCVPLLRVDRGATSLSPAPASVCMLADRYTRLMRCEPPPALHAACLPACLPVGFMRAGPDLEGSGTLQVQKLAAGVGISVTFTGTGGSGGGGSLVVSLLCDESQQGADSLPTTPTGYLSPVQLEWRTFFTCPAHQNAGLSVGSLVLISMGVAGLLYCGAGYAYNSSSHRLSGAQAMPHAEFWLELPRYANC
jgi:hypothetical protein